MYVSFTHTAVSIGCLVTSAVLSSGAGEVVADSAGNWTEGPVVYCGASYCPWTYDSLAREVYPHYNDTQIEQVLDEHLNTVSDVTVRHGTLDYNLRHIIIL